MCRVRRMYQVHGKGQMQMDAEICDPSSEATIRCNRGPCGGSVREAKVNMGEVKFGHKKMTDLSESVSCLVPRHTSLIRLTRLNRADRRRQR